GNSLHGKPGSVALMPSVAASVRLRPPHPSATLCPPWSPLPVAGPETGDPEAPDSEPTGQACEGPRALETTRDGECGFTRALCLAQLHPELAPGGRSEHLRVPETDYRTNTRISSKELKKRKVPSDEDTASDRAGHPQADMGKLRAVTSTNNTVQGPRDQPTIDPSHLGSTSKPVGPGEPGASVTSEAGCSSTRALLVHGTFAVTDGPVKALCLSKGNLPLFEAPEEEKKSHTAQEPTCGKLHTWCHSLNTGLRLDMADGGRPGRPRQNACPLLRRRHGSCEDRLKDFGTSGSRDHRHLGIPVFSAEYTTALSVPKGLENQTSATRQAGRRARLPHIVHGRPGTMLNLTEFRFNPNKNINWKAPASLFKRIRPWRDEDFTKTMCEDY
ncbi:hypothetical protein MJT46_017383, partial [Ovis ammon polii x Ovis aries]